MNVNNNLITNPLIRILIVTPDPSHLAAFMEALKQQSSVEVIQADSETMAMSHVQQNLVDAVVVDDKLWKQTGLRFLRTLIGINPLIHSAVISSLSPSDFHEASEGMGVLMQLPDNSGEEDALEFLHRLKQMHHLTTRRLDVSCSERRGSQ